MCLLGLQIESVVAFLDEALLAHELADEPADKSGDHEGADNEADPVHSRVGRGGGEVNAESGVLFAHGGRPTGDEADLAAEAGGAHAGVDGSAVHLELEQAGGERAVHDGSDHGREICG